MAGLESDIYKALRTANDVKAISKGPKAVSRRIQRRFWGKMFSRLMRDLVK